MHAGIIDHLMAIIKTPLQTHQTHLAGMGLARVMEIIPIPVTCTGFKTLAEHYRLPEG